MASSFDSIFVQLLKALQTAEKRHRTVRDNASDNSNWDTYDSEGELITRIINWRRVLEPLREEIVASGAIADEDISSVHTVEDIQFAANSVSAPSRQSEPSFSSDEEIKVGKYIREKLRELSRSGYAFSTTQIQQLCDTNWCKEVFSYPVLLPFARKYDKQYDLSIQTKDKNGKYRYWSEIFNFGGVDLLIISQWYEKGRESFDKWFNGLSRPLPVAMPDTHVLRKTVDWSTLNYGVTIPVANWDSFFAALGHTVNAGDSCNITIEIKDYTTELFRATVIHANSGVSNTIQIRYVPASKIATELRRIFENTFSYCNLERSKNIKSTRVLVPDELAEYIEICATGTPNALRFVCSPRITDGAIDADTIKSDSTTTRTKPTKIILLGKEYPIRAWNDLFVKVCEVMLLHSPYIMATMDKDNEFNTKQRIHFSYIQSEIAFRGKRLSNGLWIETNENSNLVIDTCRRLIEKCGFSPDELKVETMEV